MPNILIIVGSLRKHSLNRQLAEYIAKSLNDDASIEFLDWSGFPVFNQDLEFPAPDCVSAAREQVAHADAIWIVTPEYNWGVPGGLKNAIDWLSRPLEDGTAASIIGKVCTVSGVGGGSCARNSFDCLISTLNFLKMDIPQASFTGVGYTRHDLETSVLEITDYAKASIEQQKIMLFKKLGKE